MTTHRQRIRPALQRAAARLLHRGHKVDNDTLRILRDYGLECIELAARASTIPAPPPETADVDTGRYSIQHPLYKEPDK